MNGYIVCREIHHSNLQLKKHLQRIQITGCRHIREIFQSSAYNTNKANN